MTARNVSMGAPFRWLTKAVDVGRRNPRALFGGFAILAVVGLVPTVVQMVLQAVLVEQPVLMWSIYALVMVAALVAMPPLTGAAIRMMHACETGQPASAMDVFSGYRDSAFAVRMVLTALLLMAMYLLIVGVLLALMPGKELMIEVFSRSMATPPGGQPDMSGLPEFDPADLPWMLMWFLGAGLAMIATMHVQMLAYCHAALGGHGPVASVAGGLAGSLRNVLPLFVFVLAMLAVGFVVALVLGVVVGLLAAVLIMVSPVLAGVVMVPVYLGLMLVAYVLIFGFYYHAWRDIFGEPAADPMDAIAA